VSRGGGNDERLRLHALEARQCGHLTSNEEDVTCAAGLWGDGEEGAKAVEVEATGGGGGGGEGCGLGGSGLGHIGAGEARGNYVKGLDLNAGRGAAVAAEGGEGQALAHGGSKTSRAMQLLLTPQVDDESKRVFGLEDERNDAQT